VREDKEETNIRKDGDDKDINKENTIWEGESFNERARSFNFRKGFVIGGRPNLIQSNISTYNNTEVGTPFTQG
jgi:hypothetical protein